MRRPLIMHAMLAVLMLAPAAHAEEAPKPDDRVTFELSAEDWVATKTARITVNVMAAMNGANAGAMRGEMMKSVESLSSADWRLTGFTRSQDQTGLERWNASFEARLAEKALGGLADTAKKLSKPGMQLVVADIDFSPTLDEVEAVRSSLRVQLYKKVADQLTALNSALPGRTYRIAAIDFGGSQPFPPAPGQQLLRGTMPMAAAMADSAESEPPAAERSEKIRLTVHVALETAPVPAATETKR